MAALVVAFVALAVPASATTATDESAVVFDDDDDDDDDWIPPVIYIDNVEVDESSETITFTIWKERKTPIGVLIGVETVGIEATPDVDYVDQSTTIVLPRRKNVAEKVTFQLIDDSIAEGTERFAVLLTVPFWAVVVEVGGIGTILDNDKPPGVEVDIGDGVAVVEGGEPDTVTVRLLSEPTAEVTVNVTTDTTQLQTTPGALVFDAGNWATPQRLEINALADGLVEEDPHEVAIGFAVQSEDPSYSNFAVEDIEATIEDEDLPTAAISGPTAGSPGQPTAGSPGQPATFTAVVDMGGTSIEDYSWDVFLDGDPIGVGDTASYAFTPTASGNYVVRLAVTDADGQTLTAFINYTVFGDIADSPFAADIIWLATAGITKGCNPPANDMFCPDDKLTRGQMAAFLVRFFGLTDSGAGDIFTDDDNSVFENDIDKLATAGITTGCNPPEGTLYCPDELMNRGHMAGFLSRALSLTDDGGGDLFVDDDVWIFEADIDKLATAGITRGCNPPVNDRYCPGDYVTRGQMAAFLHRASTLVDP